MTPEDMRGFKFMTVSVAPRPSVSGGPPPAPSMAVGQFFDLEEGKRDLSPQFMLLSTSSPKDLFLKEDHPLASILILSFAVSLGLLLVTLSMKIVGCGISNYGIPDDKAARDLENFNKEFETFLRSLIPLNSYTFKQKYEQVKDISIAL
ncbi:hypothetical protein ACFE04_025646 [Oxalis oulophora]